MKPDSSCSALRVDHPPVTECYALRFEHDGRSIVFSADTAYFPPLAGFARGADILVHEAMLEEGIDRLVARTGNGARLKEHLLASHTLAAMPAVSPPRPRCGHLVHQSPDTGRRSRDRRGRLGSRRAKNLAGPVDDRARRACCADKRR